MKTETITINEKYFTVKNYKNSITDYRALNNLVDLDNTLEFLPQIDLSFFIREGYSIPAVKIDEETYLFPTTIIKDDTIRGLLDYQGYCITDIDLLTTTQNYYYNKLKIWYEKSQKELTDIDGINELYRTYRLRGNFKKRGSNTMSKTQYKLAGLIYGKEVLWRKHRELQDEIKQKQTDIKLWVEENNGSFYKGEITSYGKNKLNQSLYNDFGVMVKLQNGKLIGEEEINKIKKGLVSFYDTVKDITSWAKSHELIISYSQEKCMHGRSAKGIFYPYFKAIGVSDIHDLSRTLSHELGHFMDYYIGSAYMRNYGSDDKNAISGQIAKVYRENMRERQTSEYRNRTTECFARAIEQYYCIKNNITIGNTESSYCDNIVFKEKIESLVGELLNISI